MTSQAFPHRIARLRWQARAGNPADALALRSLLREQTELVEAVLEGVLSRLDTPGQLQHIEKLELPLGRVPLEQLHATLPSRLAGALAEVLPATLASAAALTAEGGPVHVPVHPPVAVQAQTGGTGVSGTPGHPLLRVTALNEAAHRRMALQHYLLRGHLPWEVAGLTRETLRALLITAARELAAQWRQEGAQAAWAALSAPPAAPAAMVLLRWLALLPEAEQQQLASGFDTWANGPGGVTAQHWSAALRATDESSRLPLLAAALTWQAAAASAEGDSLLGWLRAQADGTGTGEDAARQAWNNALHSLAAADAMQLEEPAGTELPTPPQAAGREPAGGSEPGERPPAWTQGRSPAGDNKPTSTPAAAAGLTVPLAGLVLLHPYLARLFIGQGLYPPAVASGDAAAAAAGRGRGPIDPARLPRAAALLHWLATGEEAGAQEFEAPVIKLLLGLDPLAPLTWPMPPLDRSARDEGDALLQAAIGHWSALRATRPAGLRLSFLQRGGLLRRSDHHWRLQVQPESFDLLLARLPWALGWIQLPWMPAPLEVDWGTA
jgi:hypothetical protein